MERKENCVLCNFLFSGKIKIFCDTCQTSYFEIDLAEFEDSIDLER